ncbi:Endoglucanase cel12C-like protein [Elsinoe fawcettii]|nr:Endoglucanase cel12C-like protein [Elsinoe fawcettii]
MHFSTLFATALAATAVTASPLDKRAAMCGQWDNVVSGTYTLYNNLWGRDAGTGSQCTNLDGTTSGGIKWNTKWSWSGGQYNVKSYANVVTKISQLPLSRLSSLASVWSWTYTGSGIVANVAYDLFTGSSATSSAQYEIMIWVGALGGAGPISSTGSPIATVSLAGKSWKLWKGPNGQMTVFSFVADGNVGSFNADLKVFVDYLTKSQGLPTSQVLQSVGAGTEPFVGSNAVFTTSSYSLKPVFK